MWLYFLFEYIYTARLYRFSQGFSLVGFNKIKLLKLIEMQVGIWDLSRIGVCNQQSP
jgi:hypothetical protein